MVDLAIPLAAGLAVVIFRGLKRHREGSHRLIEDVQKNAFADMSAGALVSVGINAIVFAAVGVGIFPLEPFDLRLLLAVGGVFTGAEGTKQIHKNLFSQFQKQE